MTTTDFSPLPAICYSRWQAMSLDAGVKHQMVHAITVRYVDMLPSLPKPSRFRRASAYQTIGHLDGLAATVAMILGLDERYVAETMSRCDRPGVPKPAEVSEIVSDLLWASINRPAESKLRAEWTEAGRG